MPALDRLADKLRGSDFEVVALSIDRTGMGPIRSFYDKTGIRNPAHISRSGFRRDGSARHHRRAHNFADRCRRQEIRRSGGPVEWDSPEVVELIQSRTNVSANKHSQPALSEPPESAKEQIRAF